MNASLNGIPAFPNESGHAIYEGRTVAIAREGMSLRDYFAAAALQGMTCAVFAETDHRAIAEDAFIFADAMLAAREAAK